MQRAEGPRDPTKMARHKTENYQPIRDSVAFVFDSVQPLILMLDDDDDKLKNLPYLNQIIDSNFQL